jgi:putative ABC transport system permease protein
MTKQTPAGAPARAPSPVLIGWLLIGQWRAQPGRLATAVLAIAIGVALSLAIELVNRSALSEFGDALAIVNGQAQASIAARSNGMAESVYEAVLADPAIAAASPVVEGSLSLNGKALTIIGLDPMRAAEVTPGLLPRGVDQASAEGTAQGSDQGSASSLFADDALFLSNAALALWQVRVGDRVSARRGLETVSLRIAGTVPGAGAGQALGVMDIGAAQWRLGWLGRLTRIDLRLAAGGTPAALAAAWATRLPADAIWTTPSAGAQRMSNLSRAYRVNLSVLALVALFTGGFIVHATISLATARQAPTLALLAVLGARPRHALQCVLAQACALGLAGAVLGVAAGVLLAAALLRLVGGDLGGGYFSGLSGSLVAAPLVLVLFGGLGLATALLGSAGAALAVRRQSPSQALKTAGDSAPGNPAAARRLALALATIGTVLTFLPAWNGLPLAAYAAIACWLFAGIALVGPITALAGRWADALIPGAWRHPAAWLALQRIRGAPQSAAVALSGVVASFALASAMTIMVDSFRHSVADWLDTVLPADLYGRAGTAGALATLTPDTQRRLAAIDGIAQVEFLRSLEIALDPARPPVGLMIRVMDPAAPQRHLPMIGLAVPVAPDARPVWISEAMVDLYGLKPGAVTELPIGGRWQRFQVAGIWRDYARQHGAVVISRQDYLTLTGDDSASDIAIRLAPGASEAQVIQRIRTGLPALAPIELRSSRGIRELSLRIFDRSFAVTYVLEAIAIVVGLFGVAATYTGQALARAREFGMLRHLGVTRRQVMALFAIESGLLITAGVAWGALLGSVIAVVLVHRVNPQSFHWTMDMHWPGPLLAASALSLVALGILAAVAAARSAAGTSPVRAVRQDW